MLASEIVLTIFLFLLPASLLGILFLSFRYYRKKSQKQLTRKQSEIEQAYDELLTIWNRDRYLEHKTITKWLQNWSHLEPLIAKSVNSKLSNLELKSIVTRLLSVLKNSEDEVSHRNESFIQKETVEFKELFNSVEKYPLTQNQIRSIITDEFSNLVIAGAGTVRQAPSLGRQHIF